MKYDKILEDILGRKDFLVVGKNVERYDALDKCLGLAKFTEDYIPKNTLIVKVFRSTRPHAIIKRLDIENASKVKDVYTILTAEDVSQNQIGYALNDQPLLNGAKVHYIGDPVALVCASDENSAYRALEKIKVTYEDLPNVLKIDQSLSPTATKIHENGNIALTTKIKKGDIDQGFSEAFTEVEETYNSPYQEHMYLEPEAAFAIPEGKNKVTVIGCIQSPFLVREKVAYTLGLPLNRVRIIQALTGGAFGGKDDMGPLVCAKAALAAVKTGRPCSLIYDREESASFSPKRFPARIKYRTGATEEGKLTAAEVDITLDCGAYANRAPFWLWRQTAHAAGPYEVPNVYVDGRAVYTNKVFGGSFRGFGDLAIHFAAETQVDAIARKLGMDPIELRLKNVLRVGSRTTCDQLLDHSVGIEKCLRGVAESSSWEKRRKIINGTKVRGFGVGCAYHGISTSRSIPDWAASSLLMNQDGSFTYRTGICELGQGTAFGHAKIVSEILGAPVESISIERPDTDSTLNTKPTHGSRGLMLGGTAAADAALKLMRRLTLAAADKLYCKEDEIKLEQGYAFKSSEPMKRIHFSELAEELYSKGVNPGAYGFYVAPTRFYNPETGLGVNYSVYTYAASVSEVEVDIETGEVTVLKIWPAMDVGKAIDPLIIEGQIHGAVSQGMGIALMENLITEEGQVLNPGFKDYIVPSSMDTPEICDAILVEEPYKNSAFGAKGVGEPAIISIVPSITNAITHATGLRFTRIPITSEALFNAMKRVAS
jgi:CO/xanthine dehydrogenase Mo-binding subunit